LIFLDGFTPISPLNSLKLNPLSWPSLALIKPILILVPVPLAPNGFIVVE
jgi:hypothetical protein